MRGKDKGGRRWYVNTQGQTLVLIDGPVAFRMGSPEDEPDRYTSEIPHLRSIPRRFAIATKEVTVEQYQGFLKQNPKNKRLGIDRFSPGVTCPVNGLTWYEAVAFCNWLSEQEGIPEDQWCYEPNSPGDYAARMRIKAGALERTGYRLPTEAEWEYACRAGAGTSRHYGLSDDLLPRYARHLANGGDHSWPVGGLLPNDLGLFDMLGNCV